MLGYIRLLFPVEYVGLESGERCSPNVCHSSLLKTFVSLQTSRYVLVGTASLEVAYYKSSLQECVTDLYAEPQC